MSEEEIVEDFVQTLRNAGVAETWTRLERGDLGILHHSIGLNVQAHYKIEDKEMPMRIIEKVWEKLKND